MSATTGHDLLDTLMGAVEGHKNSIVLSSLMAVLVIVNRKARNLEITETLIEDDGNKLLAFLGSP